MVQANRGALERLLRLLAPLLREGMVVLEPGCAMGFFTLPLASINLSSILGMMPFLMLSLTNLLPDGDSIESVEFPSTSVVGQML